MKKVFHLLAFMLVAQFTNAQWNLSNTGQISLIDEICVINDDVIWLKDQRDTLISISEDGGLTWDTKQIPLSSTGGFWAVDNSTAYMVKSMDGDGTKGIYKTTNKGNSWSLLPATFEDGNSFPNAIYFWDANNGVAIGDAYPNSFFEIYTTSNGGESWQAVPSTSMPESINEWTFNSERIIKTQGDILYFKTSQGRIFKTKDKGFSWSVITTPITDGANMSFAFKDVNYGVITHHSSDNRTFEAYTTNNGGTTWTQVDFGNNFAGEVFYDKSSDRFYNTNHHYGINYSDDNGATWQSNPYFQEEGLQGVGISPNGKLFLGGWYGKVFVSDDYFAENTVVESVSILNDHVLQVSFSSSVDMNSALNVNNYSATLRKGYSQELIINNVKAIDNATFALTVSPSYEFTDTIDISINSIFDSNMFPVMGQKSFTNLVFMGCKQIYPKTANINGQAITLTSESYLYQFDVVADTIIWTAIDEDINISSASNTQCEIKFATPGQYKIIAKATTDCDAYSDTIVVNAIGNIAYTDTTYADVIVYDTTKVSIISIDTSTLGIEDLLFTNNLKVYPNPAEDYFIIESKNTISEIAIYNGQGTEVIREEIQSTTAEFTLEDFNSKGLYVLKATIGDKIISLQLMIE